jgi:hypothetical protein
MKLNKEQRAKLISVLNEADPSTKHGRWSNEKLIEKYEELKGEKPSMGEILAKYRPGYVVSITPNGRKSRCNGDKVAEALEGFEPAQIIAAAEKLLNFKKGELLERYAGMNQGQARMNVGNRLRGAVKRGDITVKEIEKAVAHG